MYNFLFRNFEIQIKKQIRIDNQYILNIIIEIINKFFEKLNLLIIIYIKLKNKQNINEVDIIKDQGLNNIVFGNIEKYFI